jgi:type IV pilus assembly protein PilM
LFDNIASIDIGSSSIKIIKLKRGFKKFEITSLINEKIDLDLADRDYNSAVNDAFSRILENNDLSDCRIITTAPSDKLSLREMTFPFSDITKIAAAVPYEAKEKIPYDISSVTFDFQTLPVYGDNSGKILFAAIDKSVLEEKVNLINRNGLYPVFTGLESNGLFRCYEYFNTVNDESVIQIDTGYKKSIINIIQNNSVTYTRVIPLGIEKIISRLAHDLSISRNEALTVFESLEVDINKKDDIKNSNYKDSGLSKTKFKALHENTRNLFLEICREVIVTVTSDNSRNDFSMFSRIIMSGGGSNIKGLSGFVSDIISLPAVFMPFFNEYTDQNIKSRFSVCFGNILVYMNHRETSINLLRGDLLPEGAENSFEKYRMPVFFISTALIILIFNFIITFFLVNKNSNYYENILRDRYKRFFNTQNAPNDPLSEAVKKLNSLKKELSVIKAVTGEKDSFMSLISSVVKNFPDSEGFDLKKLTYDGNSMILEGEIRSSSELEIFKNNLRKSELFESVSSDIRDSNATRSIFTMTIKRKLEKE